MKPVRRKFPQGSAIATASAAVSSTSARILSSPREGINPPVSPKWGNCSFRKFGQVELGHFMKELNTPYLSVNDYHLSIQPARCLGGSEGYGPSHSRLRGG